MAGTEQLLNTIDTLVSGYVTRDDSVGDDAMRSAPQPIDEPEDDDLFGEPIHIYTRADALADGVLVEVPADLVRDAGLRVPLALTAAAWEDCVAWDDADNRRKGIGNDETGRLWDVVWMARMRIAALRGGNASRVRFSLYRVPRPRRPAGRTRPRRGPRRPGRTRDHHHAPQRGLTAPGSPRGRGRPRPRGDRRIPRQPLT